MQRPLPAAGLEAFSTEATKTHSQNQRGFRTNRRGSSHAAAKHTRGIRSREDGFALQNATTVRCVAHYDNSEHNLWNPDPTIEVGWGEQTWDEMLIGYFDVAVPRHLYSPTDAQSKTARLNQQSLRAKQLLVDRLLQALKKLDADGDGKLSRAEVPPKYADTFKQLDRNSDGTLTVQEVRKAGN